MKLNRKDKKSIVIRDLKKRKKKKTLNEDRKRTQIKHPEQANDHKINKDCLKNDKVENRTLETRTITSLRR